MQHESGKIVEADAKVSERVLFTEFKEVHQQIEQLCASVVSLESDKHAGKDRILANLRQTFDKYLEFPTLLDKHVESMVSALSNAAISCLQTIDMNIADIRASSLCYILSVLYVLCKVRGRKRIQKFLSHEVSHVELVFKALCVLSDQSSKIKEMKEVDNGNGFVQDQESKPQLWESVYSIWVWMGKLSLVPFDSGVIVDSQVIITLVDLGKRHLCDAGPTRDVASACLAFWLARPDLEDSHTRSFVVYCKLTLNKYADDGRHIFQCIGILQTIVALMKTSKSDRNKIVDLLRPLWLPLERIAESKSTNNILGKLMVKYWTRIGSLLLPPRIATWRYQRGRRSLRESVSRGSAITTGTTSKSNKTTPVIEHQEQAGGGREDREALFHVPDQVEDVMGRVLEALQDSATPVRWSAAKGIGRITERLPAVCADDALDALLDMFEDVERDHAWHGACLALAELARRGLLLPHRLVDAMPKIVEAIQYDLPRRQTSVGSNVRDAACYAYWACARAYEPSVLRPFVLKLSQTIVVTSILDREVNCRRAASAAFQEMVGRQGAKNFPHGIEILTTADYFSLGNRIDAYTTIAWEVGTFLEYRRPLIDHLYRTKMKHWDENVRDIASKSLGGFIALDSQYIVTTVMPYLLERGLDPKNVQLRHGAVIGLAEIMLGFSKNKILHDKHLSGELLLDIAELVPKIEKQRLYRGKGGEVMRFAVCRLVECLSIAEIPLSVPQQVRLLDTIDSCIPHPKEKIQRQACEALGALMKCYFPVGDKGPSARLQKRVVDKYVQQLRTNTNPAATRGFSMALGYLPGKLLAPSETVLDTVLASLCRASRPTSTVGTEKDAETRRNSLESLARVCKTVGTNKQQSAELYNIHPLGENQIGHILNAFFAALDDYNMDRRGDVGSWSRIAAMEGLVAMVHLIAKECGASTNLFTEGLSARLLGGLFKQLSEKLDAVRARAGSCLERVMEIRDPAFPYMPDEERLKTIFFDIKRNTLHTNWSDPSFTFPIVIRGLEIDKLFQPIISGLILSIGGLTESVSKEASHRFVQWVKQEKGTEQMNKLGQTILELFKKYSQQGRVIQPLLKTMDLLMTKLCIDDLLADEFFVDSLMERLYAEESGCTDIRRIFSIISIVLGLMHIDGRRNEAMEFMTKLLAHEFPRIRRYAAENLYVSLLEDRDVSIPIKQQDAALAYLMANTWDADIDEGARLEMAHGLASLLGVQLQPETMG